MTETIYAGKMPILALRGLAVFPEQTVHFDVGRKKSVLALDAAMKGDQTLLLIPQNEKSFAPTEAQDNAYSGLTDRYYGDTKAEAPAENAPEVPAGGTANSASVIAVPLGASFFHIWCVSSIRTSY